MPYGPLPLGTAGLVVLGLLGAAVGSFANVCIARWPHGQSVTRPASHCPYCQTRLAPADLVPVLSFLWLRGRCRYCGRPIGWQHPLVEAAFALAFVAIGALDGLSVLLLPHLVLFFVLAVALATDLAARVIPNQLTFGGAAAAVVTNLLVRPGFSVEMLVAGTAAAGFLALVAVASRGGMGGGDVKLAAVMGLLLGRFVVVALILAFVTGALLGVTLLVTGRKRRRDALPFGPFLAAGGLVAAFWGQQLWQVYQAVAGLR